MTRRGERRLGRTADPTLAPPGPRPGRALRLLGAAVGIVLTVACSGGTAEEGDEDYLRGSTGPYRGRVIDALTKQPIPRAVVLAVWYYDVPAVVQNLTRFHDALEVLTDAEGYFVVDAPAIERRAPRRTTFPVFTIFKPGYRYYRGWFASSEAMADRKNRPLLGVVELTRVAGKGRAERLRNLGVRPGGGVPDEKIPNLLRAMDEESKELGHEQQ